MTSSRGLCRRGVSLHVRPGSGAKLQALPTVAPPPRDPHRHAVGLKKKHGFHLSMPRFLREACLWSGLTTVLPRDVRPTHHAQVFCVSWCADVAEWYAVLPWDVRPTHHAQVFCMSSHADL